MMVIYEEALSDKYLLVLAPGKESPNTEIVPCFRRACRSGRPAVWADCRLLEAGSSEEVATILACQNTLSQHHTELVLCRVSEELEQALRRHAACPRIVPSWQEVD